MQRHIIIVISQGNFVITALMVLNECISHNRTNLQLYGVVKLLVDLYYSIIAGRYSSIHAARIAILKYGLSTYMRDVDRRIHPESLFRSIQSIICEARIIYCNKVKTRVSTEY